jgi:hypothetical protein
MDENMKNLNLSIKTAQRIQLAQKHHKELNNLVLKKVLAFNDLIQHLCNYGFDINPILTGQPDQIYPFYGHLHEYLTDPEVFDEEEKPSEEDIIREITALSRLHNNFSKAANDENLALFAFIEQCELLTDEELKCIQF